MELTPPSRSTNQRQEPVITPTSSINTSPVGRPRKAISARCSLQATRYELSPNNQQPVHHHRSPQNTAPARKTSPSSSKSASPESTTPQLRRSTRHRMPPKEIYPYKLPDPKSRKSPRKFGRSIEEENFDLETAYNWSDCRVSRAYDRAKNFVPQAGPSRENFYEDVNLPGYYETLRTPWQPSLPLTPQSTPRSTPRNTPRSTPQSTPQARSRGRKRKATTPGPLSIRTVCDDDNDIEMQTALEESMLINSSPSLNSSQPLQLSMFIPEDHEVGITEANIQRGLQPMLMASVTTDTAPTQSSAPTVSQPQSWSEPSTSSGLPEAAQPTPPKRKVVNRMPFYSNPEDIPPDECDGNRPWHRLDHLPEYVSNVPILANRLRKKAQASGDQNQSCTQAPPSPKFVREQIAGGLTRLLEPEVNIPSPADAQNWLENRVTVVIRDDIPPGPIITIEINSSHETTARSNLNAPNRDNMELVNVEEIGEVTLMTYQRTKPDSSQPSTSQPTTDQPSSSSSKPEPTETDPNPPSPSGRSRKSSSNEPEVSP